MRDCDRNLSALSRSDAGRLKEFSETLIPELGDIEVLRNRTGLVMVPIRDTAKQVAFHLGEVLVSEAHIRSGDHQGYGMTRGCDLEASMAMALVDLALSKGVQMDACTSFCVNEANQQAKQDRETLCWVEATRVKMETF